MWFASTASPGLPITPNGSTVFNFPMISPAKQMRSVLPTNKGGKSSDGIPGTGGTISYQPTAMLAGNYLWLTDTDVDVH